MKPSIIVAISVMLIILVYTFVGKKKSTETPVIVKLLLDFAERNGSSIHQFDYLANLVIGFSQSDMKLYFLKIVNGKNVFSQIALNELKDVTLSKNVRRANSGDSVIDSIALVFSNKNKSKHAISFEFYNLDFDGFTFYSELELAEKWNKTVSNLLTH